MIAAPSLGGSAQNPNQGCASDALAEALDRLEQRVDSTAYAALLRQCGNAKALAEGKRVHEHIVRAGYEQDTFLGNLLVQMYGNCSSLEDACRVFDQMHHRNVFSWNIMIAVYAQNGHLQDARDMFERMPRRNVMSWNAMITAYAQCGYIEKARSMFEKMPHRSIVSWNAIITAYAQNGHGRVALHLFRVLDLEGEEPNKVSFITVLDACASIPALAEGKIIHAVIADNGLESDVLVGTTLLNMYGKCGSLADAMNVFNRMPRQDVVAWNALITAYVQNGHLQEATDFFNKMPQKNVISWNAIVAAYTQAGHLQEARTMFDKMPQRNVASWNTLLAGYAQNGHPDEALQLFARMDLEAVQPDKVTYISVLDACGDLRDLTRGKDIHSAIIYSRVSSDVTVGNALVSMYGKCRSVEYARHVFDRVRHKDVVLWTTMVAAYALNGHLEEARAAFDQMPQRNVVSWNAMISAYVQSGQCKEALLLFANMDLEGVQADAVTFMSVFDACTNLPALALGRLIHHSLEVIQFKADVAVKTALVNMYGKCGKLSQARQIFDSISEQDVVLFSTMISAYAQNGCSSESFQLFQLMHLEGVQPNEITLVTILAACSHAGLWRDGWQYFASMAGDYGMVPSLDHYVCMVDLLGRAGQVHEAEELALNMPFEPDAVTWKTLLSACRVHGNVAIAGRAAETLAKLDHENTSSYILLSNMFAGEPEPKRKG